MESKAEKRSIRARIRDAIARIGPEERAERSARILERLLVLPEFRASRRPLLFVSLPDEFDTRPIVGAALEDGKRVFLPRTRPEEKSMRFFALEALDGLRVGAYGIEEPPEGEEADPGSLDFILLPGRAFDRRGNRLGRGGGFYDRFLSDPRVRAVRCGAAYDCQVLDEIPVSPTDMPVDILITESRTLRFAGVARGASRGEGGGRGAR